MKSYTKSQTLYILREFKHLIGNPMDNEVNITQIFAYPTNTDEVIMLRQGLTAHAIVESAPDTALFYVKALSTDLVNRQGTEHIPLILREPIETYLSSREMEEVLSH